jgi:hypothetical protein
MLIKDMMRSISNGVRTGGIIMSFASLLSDFSFMNVVDRAIMNLSVWLCRNIFHYNAERACEAILKDPFEHEYREYILEKYEQASHSSSSL